METNRMLLLTTYGTTDVVIVAADQIAVIVQQPALRSDHGREHGSRTTITLKSGIGCVVVQESPTAIAELAGWIGKPAAASDLQAAAREAADAMTIQIERDDLGDDALHPLYQPRESLWRALG